MPISEGLVAEQLSPQMLSNASDHPRFKYFPEAREDSYHSFLGVPIVDRGLLLGVLVVQTIEPRAFTADEVRMAATAAAQVAPGDGNRPRRRLDEARPGS
jgi:signal transduction protein with GAF and PtsI domain